MTAGARATYDIVPNAASDAKFSGEVFVRAFFSPNLAAEVSVGRRTSSFYEFGGRHSEGYSLDQYPIFLGASYLFSPKAVFRPLLAGGVVIAPSSYSGSSYLYPNPTEYTSGNATAVLPWLGMGFSIYVPSSWVILDAGVRYVFGRDATVASDSPYQAYARIQLGIGCRF